MGRGLWTTCIALRSVTISIDSRFGTEGNEIECYSFLNASSSRSVM